MLRNEYKCPWLEHQLPNPLVEVPANMGNSSKGTTPNQLIRSIFQEPALILCGDCTHCTHSKLPASTWFPASLMFRGFWCLVGFVVSTNQPPIETLADRRGTDENRGYSLLSPLFGDKMSTATGILEGTLGIPLLAGSD